MMKNPRINAQQIYRLLLIASLIVTLLACSKPEQKIRTMSENSQKYYSSFFGVNLSGLEDTALLEELISWFNTPYKEGMSEKNIGADCSGFVQSVYRNVYGINLKRSAEQMVKQINPINRRKLKFGNLVFFKNRIGFVAHVGIYIGDGKFIHASSNESSNITISSLYTKYYKKRYWTGGEVKDEVIKR